MNRNLGSLEPTVSSSEEKGVIIMNLKYILSSRIKILSKAETILFEGLIIFLEGHMDISSVCIDQIKTYYKDGIQNLILYIREQELFELEEHERENKIREDLKRQELALIEAKELEIRKAKELEDQKEKDFWTDIRIKNEAISIINDENTIKLLQETEIRAARYLDSLKKILEIYESIPEFKLYYGRPDKDVNQWDKLYKITIEDLISKPNCCRYNIISDMSFFASILKTKLNYKINPIPIDERKKHKLIGTLNRLSNDYYHVLKHGFPKTLAKCPKCIHIR